MSDETPRAVPFYCPFCGEQDLRPAEDQAEGWVCASCERVFGLKLIAVGGSG